MNAGGMAALGGGIGGFAGSAGLGGGFDWGGFLSGVFGLVNQFLGYHEAAKARKRKMRSLEEAYRESARAIGAAVAERKIAEKAAMVQAALLSQAQPRASPPPAIVPAPSDQTALYIALGIGALFLVSQR